jgi:hypothetical protein
MKNQAKKFYTRWFIAIQFVAIAMIIAVLLILLSR